MLKIIESLFLLRERSRLAQTLALGVENLFRSNFK